MKEQQPLVWSDESPTESGFYWLRQDGPLSRVQVVELKEDGLIKWTNCRQASPGNYPRGQWAGPIALPVDEPQEQEWVPLADLRPGAIFETQEGARAVKSEYHFDSLACRCILLGSGEYAHFKNGNSTLVREIAIG